MPDPVLGGRLRRLHPLATLERQIELVHEFPEKHGPQSALLGLVRAIDFPHELVPEFLSGGLGHGAGAEGVISAMPGIVVVEHYPFLGLSSPPQLEAPFLKSPAF